MVFTDKLHRNSRVNSDLRVYIIIGIYIYIHIYIYIYIYIYYIIYILYYIYIILYIYIYIIYIVYEFFMILRNNARILIHDSWFFWDLLRFLKFVVININANLMVSVQLTTPGALKRKAF